MLLNTIRSFAGSEKFPSIAIIYQYFNLDTHLKNFKYFCSTLTMLLNTVRTFAVSEWVPSIAIFTNISI